MKANGGLKWKKFSTWIRNNTESSPIMTKLKYFLIIYISFLTIFPLFEGRAETIKRQPIPIGMFNVSAPDRFNLGERASDLRQVWNGVPTNWQGGYYPYEACNLVQHYKDWDGSTDAEWWIDYLNALYREANEDGEVRLRAIIGTLYPPYEVFGDKWLKEFIKELCEWEQSGPWNGVIAGWYLAEEPMGGAHNYDINIYDKMVSTIKSAEKEIGCHHELYVNVVVGSAYYTANNLARFARPADVVMIGVNTYLWLGRANHPVYDPDWYDITEAISVTRKHVFADREKNNLPYPEIHVVLQVYDTEGYGQPTNWEIRQQIRTALTPFQTEFNETVEPADGIWFFWWPGLTFKNEDKISDWLYGRRVAEAIELEVADIMELESEVQWANSPDRTRFLFPVNQEDTFVFDPDESSIPYQLKQSGKVRITISDEFGNLIENFNLGIQSAGRLAPFGGPKLQTSSKLEDGIYLFKLYLDSILMDEVEVKIQKKPVLFPISHTPKVWSKDNVIKVRWRYPYLSKGLLGYSYLWDNSPETYPKREVNLSASETELVSESLPDGNNYYFHLRSCDKENNWSLPSHIGPFLIDTIPPQNPTSLNSDSHLVGKWESKNVIHLTWDTATDATSQVKGYSIVWDNSPNTLPAEKINIGKSVSEITSKPLPDGTWYFHMICSDEAGNWTPQPIHFGPFLIDTQTPSAPVELKSESHQTNKWSSNNIVTISWIPVSDDTEKYTYLWNNESDTDIEIEQICYENKIQVSLSDGDSHYFHIRAIDKAGQLSEVVHIGAFRIDSTPPSVPSNLKIVNPTTNGWLNTNSIVFQWDESKDENSGVSGYQVDSPEQIWLENTNILISKIPDGLHQISVRAKDNVGNLSESTSKQFRIDTTTESPFFENIGAQDQWYPEVKTINWSVKEDLSGINEFQYAWDNSADTVPDDSNKLSAGIFEFVPSEETENGVWYFHLRALDRAGNISDTVHYKFKLDQAIPKTPTIKSETHKEGEWTSKSFVQFGFEQEQLISGMVDYYYTLDKFPNTIPDKKIENDIYQTEKTDGIWYFHLRGKSKTGIWGNIAHYEIRNDTQISKPEIESPSHPEQDIWSSDNNPSFSWTIDEDLSGIKKYNWAFNQLPDKVEEWNELVTDSTQVKFNEITSVKNGIWYFHLRAIDNADNVSPTAHYKIMLDITNPSSLSINSVTHPSDKWIASSRAHLSWDIDEPISGIKGFSYQIDKQKHTVPDNTIDTISRQLILGQTSHFLEDGIWFFHIKAISNSGLLGKTAHYKFMFDTQINTPVIESSSHSSSEWSSSRICNFRWKMEDVLSGIARYNYKIDRFPNTITDLEEEIDSSQNSLDYTLESDGIWYFHLQATDNAGNISKVGHYKVMVDSSEPSEIEINSSTHPESEWTPSSSVKLYWNKPESLSGIKGYSYLLDQEPKTIPDEKIDTTKNDFESELKDGKWYFHVRASDILGKWNSATHYEIFIDTVPPFISIDFPEDGHWYNEAIVEYSGRANDEENIIFSKTESSGLDINSYQYLYKENDWRDFSNNADDGWADNDQIPHITKEGRVTLQVRVKDMAGNIGNSEKTEFFVDSLPPVLELQSATHPDQNIWSNENRVTFYWKAEHGEADMIGYNWLLDNSESTIPAQIIRLPNTIQSKNFDKLFDAIWYFHLIGSDEAGNWSKPVVYQVNIDTESPYAEVKLLKQRVNNMTIEYYPVETEPPIISSGWVKVILKVSEILSETPILSYTPFGKIPQLLNLEYSENNREWHANFFVDAKTGDGHAEFNFSGIDQAGNHGTQIKKGNYFSIDSVIRSDINEIQYLFSKDNSYIAIPPNAISDDLHLLLEKIEPAPYTSDRKWKSLAGYSIISERKKTLFFDMPLKLAVIKGDWYSPQIYYDDGVRAYQISTQIVANYLTAEVDKVGIFLVSSGKKAKSSIENGWAAPNPFAPDAGERTTFHVLTRNKNAQFTIHIYDITGRKIKTLRRDKIWDGRDENGKIVEGGIYIFQLGSETEIISGTVVVVR